MSYRTGHRCRIRMELVAQLGHLRGDRATGYELVLPLNPDGQIDATSWLDQPQACRVRQFRQGRVERHGVLARTPRGRWYFDYGSGRNAEEGEGLSGDHFVRGQFIAVAEDDGKLRTYRISSVDALTEPAAAGEAGSGRVDRPDER